MCVVRLSAEREEPGEQKASCGGRAVTATARRGAAGRPVERAVLLSLLGPCRVKSPLTHTRRRSLDTHNSNHSQNPEQQAPPDRRLSLSLARHHHAIAAPSCSAHSPRRSQINSYSPTRARTLTQVSERAGHAGATMLGRAAGSRATVARPSTSSPLCPLAAAAGTAAGARRLAASAAAPVRGGRAGRRGAVVVQAVSGGGGSASKGLELLPRRRRRPLVL